jgi:uncharacterized protein YbjT (DUF2867 family)
VSSPIPPTPSADTSADTSPDTSADPSADSAPLRTAPPTTPPDRVLVTGASGYIGGRLVGELLEAGHRVRCLVRTPAKVDAAPWSTAVEIVQGDVGGALDAALEDVDAAYYLVHSIGASRDWKAQDEQAAENFGRACARAGVSRIVYLGGLGEDDDEADLSAHLASRHEVGRALARGGVPVTELRAAVIIGSGSASFEMLRYLVEVLPAMVTPRWVETRCQPIAVRDVLRYLVEVLAVPSTTGRTYEIGGPDVLSYREMMAIYAQEAKLRPRLIIPLPVLTPRLSSLWVGLVTPLPRSLARPLVDSLVNEVVVHDDEITRVLPGPLFTYREAVRRALGRMATNSVSTSWSGAELLSTSGLGTGHGVAAPMPTDPGWSGGTVLADRRTRTIDASPADVYAVINAIGGRNGWFSSEWLWRIRGLADKVVGGPGMRRGRRDPVHLRVGDAVDFWRVEALEPDALVRLRAEMRNPGDAWLEWRIEPGAAQPEDDDQGVPGDDQEHASDTGESRDEVAATIAATEQTTVHQLARFHPRGLWGRAYWLGVAPFHRFVFPSMLRGIAEAAEARAHDDRTTLVTGPGGALVSASAGAPSGPRGGNLRTDPSRAYERET